MTCVDERSPASGLEAFPGPVLVLAPHMDDETLGCGRLIAALAERDRAVHVLFATDGARSPGVAADLVPGLVATRAAEARCAAEALGYGASRTTFLALPDGRLSRHLTDLTQGVARTWEACGPATVLAPSRWDRHPDHLALRRAAIACLRAAPVGPTLMEYFVYYRWRLLPGGDLRDLLRVGERVVPDTSEFADHKRRALACYRSQTTLYAAGQRREILPESRVDRVSTDEEVFVRWREGLPPTAQLSRLRGWVPVAHRLEPVLKRVKDRVASLARSAAQVPGVAGGSSGAGEKRGSRRVATSAGPEDADPRSRPIRIIVFASPFPLAAEWRFLARVEAHPDLELVGVLCRGTAAGRAARGADLWRRRGLLAVPLLVRDTLRALRTSEAPPADALRRLRGRMRVVPDIHAPDVLAWVGAQRPDVGVVYGGPILKPEIFRIPARGTLGVHHGRLPEYRGKKTVFWAIANGEREAGVTIQEIDAGLDTGRVVRVGAVPIGSRSYAEVSRRVQSLGVDLLLDALLAGEPAGGSATDHSLGRTVGEDNVRQDPSADGRRLATRSSPAGPLYRDPKARDLLRFAWRRLAGR